MKIGIIGSGMIGGTLSRLFTNAGHDVFVSNSRGPHSLKDLEATLGPRIKALTAEEAVAMAMLWFSPCHGGTDESFRMQSSLGARSSLTPRIPTSQRVVSTISETARQAKRSRSSCREHA